MVNGVIDFFLGWLPEMPELLDDIQGIVEQAVTTTIDTIKSADTTDWRIQVKCDLYCRLFNTGGSFGTDRSTILDGWQSDILAHSSPLIGIPFAAFVSMIPLSLFQIRARVANNNVGECDDCTDCQQCLVSIVPSTRYDEGGSQTHSKSGCRWTVVAGIDPPSGHSLLQIKSSDGSHFEIAETVGFTSEYSEWHSRDSGVVINGGVSGCGNELILAWVDAGDRTVSFLVTDCT